MTNRLRVLAVDILAPLAAIAALVFIGAALAWPRWWVGRSPTPGRTCRSTSA